MKRLLAVAALSLLLTGCAATTAPSGSPTTSTPTATAKAAPAPTTAPAAESGTQASQYIDAVRANAPSVASSSDGDLLSIAETMCKALASDPIDGRSQDMDNLKYGGMPEVEATALIAAAQMHICK